MKKRNLILCNSVYQILVALWMRHTILKDTDTDIMVSDHMKNGEMLLNQIMQYGDFQQGYYVKTFAYARYKDVKSKEDWHNYKFRPRTLLEKYWKAENSYSDVYTANLDPFVQLLYDACRRENLQFALHLYEDGMYTYSKLMEADYRSTDIPVKDLPHKILHSYIYRRQYIYGRLADAILFHPENMDWKASFPLQKLACIDKNDLAFRQLCNRIFGYEESIDVYDTKYIFMEESFAAEGTPINDIELLSALAAKVGMDNIMVKIHPRNPVNRFKEYGFKTNENTSIPWEVIVMNLDDISDKVLITVGSSSVLNPILLFDLKTRVYSLYPLVDKNACKSKLLSGEFWELVRKMFLKYPQYIEMCTDIHTIE